VTAGTEIDDEGARVTKSPLRRVVGGGVSLTCFVFIPPPGSSFLLTDPLAEEGMWLGETFRRVHEADSAGAPEIAT
jgi:hypothetical protein